METEVKVFEQLRTDLHTFVEKAQGELKQFGETQTATANAIDRIQADIKALDEKMVKQQEEAPARPLVEVLKEQDVLKQFTKGVKSIRLELTGKDALALLDRKTFTASGSAGFATSGVYQIDRRPGITLEARRVPRMADLLASRPTNLAYVDFVKVNKAISPAEMQAGEGAVKFKNSTTLTTLSRKVQTVATVQDVSRQALADYAELAGYLDGAVRYAVEKEIDDQILTGSGANDDLHGAVTTATAFNTALLPAAAGYTAIDTIGYAHSQIAAADELSPSFVVLNPQDWWAMRLLKDDEGRYLIGNPQDGFVPTLWDMTVVPTTTMTQGYFLVGSSSPVAAEIRNRAEIAVEMSMENNDNFERNVVSIRAEARLALITYRPGAFIYGALASSPA